MIKRSITLFLCIFIVSTLVPHEPVLSSANSPKLIVDYQYHEAWPYHNGVAVFRGDNEKLGLIDKLGNVIANPLYDEIEEWGFNTLSEYQAIVKIDDKEGLIDRSGIELLPARYDTIGRFALGSQNLMVAVESGHSSVYNMGQRQLLGYSYKHLVRGRNEAVGYRDGKWRVLDIHSGAEVKTLDRNYEKVEFFKDGLAAVQLNGKWGFINSSGQEVVHPTYDEVWYFSDGYAPVLKDGVWGFVNSNGFEVVKPQFESVSRFSKGGLAGVEKWGMWGLINGKGEWIAKPQYYRVFTEGRSHLVAVHKNGHWGFLQDGTGKEILKSEYDGYHYLASMSAIAIPKDGQYALFDMNGKQLTDFVYDKFSNITLDSSTGLAFVMKNGKAGIINNTGQLIVPLIYDDLHRILESPSDHLIFRAEIEGKIGFIDADGKMIMPPKYLVTGLPQEELLLVRNGGLYGFMNKDGELEVELQYHSVHSYGDGLAPVKRDPFGKWGYIAHPYDSPTSWAVLEVNEALELNLIPSIMEYGYAHNISRIEFSHLLVQLIEVKTGKPLIDQLNEFELNHDDFIDTQDEAVKSLYSLGIVSGRGNGHFDPYGEITRQEAAVMIARTAQYLGIDGIPTESEQPKFLDNHVIESWAREAVRYVSTTEDSVSGAKIMGGTSENKFSPNALFTKQQAFITMVRLFRSTPAQ